MKKRQIQALGLIAVAILIVISALVYELAFTPVIVEGVVEWKGITGVKDNINYYVEITVDTSDSVNNLEKGNTYGYSESREDFNKVQVWDKVKYELLHEFSARIYNFNLIRSYQKSYYK